MADMKTSLTHLIEVCRGFNMPFVQMLRAGQDRSTILKLIQGLDLILPNDLIEFYEFCDGVDADGRTTKEVGVYYGYSFLSLKRAVSEYQNLQMEIVTEGWDDLSRSWFPVLGIDSAFYFVDCDKASSGEPYIVSYSFEDEPTIKYQSIKSMVDTFAAYYSECAFTVEDGRVISKNKQLMAQIDRQHNPEVAHYDSPH